MSAPAWVEHVIWWHVYPLGFVGAFPADPPPEAGVAREAILEALKVAAIVSGVAQAITTAETLAAAG